MAAQFLVFLYFVVSALSLSEEATCDASKCVTDEWLSQNGTVAGYHVLCIQADKASNALNIEFFREGINERKHSGKYISDSKDLSQLRVELEHVLSIQTELTDAARNAHTNALDRPNPWAIFNADGEQIVAFEDCFGTLLVFEGGVFIYPAIRIDYERHIAIGSDTVFTLKTLSVHPPVFVVLNFLSESDCDHIVELSANKMRESDVSHMQNTNGAANKWRTSTTHWLRQSDAIIERIQSHCAALLRIPIRNQELIQVLRYEP